MTQPTRRVLSVLEILQAEHRVGGAELARRLGVDRRTIRRYITHLVEIGVPIDAERGCDGGYALRAGYKLPPMMFSAEEALALAVGLRAAQQIGLAGITPAVASTQAKLERVLPKGLHRRLRDIDRTVAMDFARPFAEGSSEALMTLSAAARAQQRVHLRYRNADGAASEREFDPYGVAYRGGAWYAVGHCHLRRDLRSFRLDRVLSAQPLPASFGRPPNFDVLGYLSTAIATLPRAHEVEVLLHTDLDTARRFLRPELAQLAPAPQGVRMRAQIDELPWMARDLARLPFGFRIVKPAALKHALAEHLQHLQAQLDTTAVPAPATAAGSAPPARSPSSNRPGRRPTRSAG
jgi:predicted DNA-binding transcriptional regulator YafY